MTNESGNFPSCDTAVTEKPRDTRNEVGRDNYLYIRYANTL